MNRWIQENNFSAIPLFDYSTFFVHRDQCKSSTCITLASRDFVSKLSYHNHHTQLQQHSSWDWDLMEIFYQFQHSVNSFELYFIYNIGFHVDFITIPPSLPPRKIQRPRALSRLNLVWNMVSSTLVDKPWHTKISTRLTSGTPPRKMVSGAWTMMLIMANTSAIGITKGS